jgi:hypothetical protein
MENQLDIKNGGYISEIPFEIICFLDSFYIYKIGQTETSTLIEKRGVRDNNFQGLKFSDCNR